MSTTRTTIPSAGPAAAAANLISYDRIDGVELNGSNVGNVVEDDTIYGNGTGQQWNAGVYILNPADTSLSGCTINDNLGWGITLTGNSPGSSITSKTNPNTVLYNELGGIDY